MVTSENPLPARVDPVATSPGLRPGTDGVNADAEAHAENSELRASPMPEPANISKRRIGRVAFLLGGTLFAASIWYIIATFKWDTTLVIIRDADLSLVAVATTTIPLYWLVRSIRWWFLLRNLQIDLPLKKLYLCSSVALGCAIITPLQSGEVLKIELLKRYSGITRFSGYSTFAVERVADLMAVFFLALVGVLLGVDLGVGTNTVTWLTAAVLLIGILTAVVFLKVDLPGRCGEFQRSMRKCVPNLRALTVLLVLTFIGWGIVAAGWFACFRSVSVPIGYIQTVMVMSTLTPLHILSLIPGAVGIAEASTTLLLVRLGHVAVYAQAGALMIRVYTLMVLGLASVHWVLWRVVPGYGQSGRGTTADSKCNETV